LYALEIIYDIPPNTKGIYMQVIAINDENKHQEFSIIGTLSWLFLLSVGIQAGVDIIIRLAINVSGTEIKEMESTFLRPDIMLIMVIMTAIISIPLIKRAAHSTDKMFPFVFLALRSTQHTTLIKIISAGLIYYSLISLFMPWLDIDYPQYMLDVKSHVKSTVDLIFLISTVCIIAPIFEEVVFRGLIFSRFQSSKFGTIGAVFITSIIFSILHFQYEPIAMLFIFVDAILLSFVRYKTENVTYCIALHILFNSLSTFQLFFLHS